MKTKRRDGYHRLVFSFCSRHGRKPQGLIWIQIWSVFLLLRFVGKRSSSAAGKRSCLDEKVRSCIQLMETRTKSRIPARKYQGFPQNGTSLRFSKRFVYFIFVGGKMWENRARNFPAASRVLFVVVALCLALLLTRRRKARKKSFVFPFRTCKVFPANEQGLYAGGAKFHKHFPGNFYVKKYLTQAHLAQ